jgi:hypothetical protein
VGVDDEGGGVNLGGVGLAGRGLRHDLFALLAVFSLAAWSRHACPPYCFCRMG